MSYSTNFRSLRRLATASALLGALLGVLASPQALAQAANTKPIRIGVPTSVQLQVGRDTLTAVKMAVDDINATGGIRGEKLSVTFADDACDPRKASAFSTRPNHAPATIVGSARCPARHGSRLAIAKD